MSSPNKVIINGLVETIKNKVEPAMLYDALQKMNNDLNKTYEALFEGPLPAVSGKNLDLTELARSSLPPGIAFVDVANTFTKVNVFTDQQLISYATQPHLRLLTTGSTSAGRVMNATGTATIFSQGLYYDGANWQVDAGNGSGWLAANGVLQTLQSIGGVLYAQLFIGLDKIIRLSGVPIVTGAVAGDI